MSETGKPPLALELQISKPLKLCLFLYIFYKTIVYTVKPEGWGKRNF